MLAGIDPTSLDVRQAANIAELVATEVWGAEAVKAWLESEEEDRPNRFENWGETEEAVRGQQAMMEMLA